MYKLETIKQQDLKDCGACSLLFIIKYYGGYVPLEKIREDTYTTTNGTTAFHLIAAAKNYGFDALGVMAKSIDDKNIYLPAIVHLNLKNGLKHFAVVYKITNKYVYLMDPAIGKVKKTKDEFNDIWSKAIILLTPISKIISFDKTDNLGNIFLNIFKNNKKLFVNIFIVNSSLILISIITSFYLKSVISCIENNKDIRLIKSIIIIFFVLTIFKVLFSYLKNNYLNYLNKNIDIAMFTEFLEHIFNLPLSFIQNRTTGEITSRISELQEIKNMASEILINVILNTILIICTVVVLSLISKELFCSLFIIICLYFTVGIIFSKIIYQQVKKQIEYQTIFNTDLIEGVEMNYSIKNLNLISEFTYILESKLIKAFKNNFNLQRLLNVIETSKNFIYEIGLFILYTYGFYLIYQNKLSILNFITFNSLISYIFNPIKDIIALVPKAMYLKASFIKLSDFLGIEREENYDGFSDINENNILVNNLSYSYNNYHNTINKLSFNINSGEKVLLYGPSGSGKSTVCKLLYKTFLNYTGNIKLGYFCEKDYSLLAIRKNILYVGQNDKLFSGTIKENIICYRSISDEKFYKATSICKIDDIVNKRPNRYNSFINASSNNLSGGEIQRIILARGLLKQANILILDEALSEVDVKLEREILDNIFANFKDKTLIYVSHKDVKNKFNKIIRINPC